MLLTTELKRQFPNTEKKKRWISKYSKVSIIRPGRSRLLEFEK